MSGVTSVSECVWSVASQELVPGVTSVSKSVPRESEAIESRCRCPGLTRVSECVCV